ncbi:MAG: hypothetical protein JWQ25_70 [Daejeonella sp.]|nr:hypothetical protein [Daejeonella sp.]
MHAGMEHFKEFLLVLQTINLKLEPDIQTLLSDRQKQHFVITHENGYKTNSYGNKLIALKEMAIIDLLPFDYMQIQIFLGRVEHISSCFNRFRQNFQDTSEDLQESSAANYLNFLLADEWFILNGFEHLESWSSSITQKFVNELRETIEFKDQILHSFLSEVKELLEYDSSGLSFTPSDAKPKVREVIPAVLPVTIIKEAREDFYKLFKDYFPEADRPFLEALIIDDKEPDKRLGFKANGNQLADAFKQLYESNLIVGCSKAQLEKWIIKNFCYVHNACFKEFSEGYLNAIISSDIKKCQSPILDIRKKEDRYVITPAFRNKKNYQTW